MWREKNVKLKYKKYRGEIGEVCVLALIKCGINKIHVGGRRRCGSGGDPLQDYRHDSWLTRSMAHCISGSMIKKN
jgi:hypothetical protein